jgi:hypothetical protein
MLPRELEARLLRDLEQVEEVRRMPYVTNAERIGLEKGLEQGRQEGLREGLLLGIEQMLRLKFGAAGSALVPEIRQIADLAVIRVISARIETATTTDQVREIYR